MTTQHTPGPWSINTAGSAKRGEEFKITEIYVYAPDTQDDTAICADVIDPVTQKPSEANARLIASAPDLLDVLNLCEGNISSLAASHPMIYTHWLNVVRAAISKATESAA